MSAILWPAIRKAAQIQGKTLTFRNATVDDADFILSLRTDQEKSRFLSYTSRDNSEQRLWLERYTVADDQAYFIIEFSGEPIGTVRLYDMRQNSFCWGSWILKTGSPKHAAIESALMVYAYACDHLGFERSHFTVDKGNQRVWEFHERFGAKRVNEDASQYFYSISSTAIEQSRVKYARFLAGGVEVFNLNYSSKS